MVFTPPRETSLPIREEAKYTSMDNEETEQPITDTKQLKQRELSPAMVKKYTEPRKTWFIMRTGDQYLFSCEEREAWNTLYDQSNWRRHDFKIMGVSDGKTYAKIIRESKQKADILLPQIEEQQKQSERYRKTEERFIFDELLELTDEKVIKVKQIIAGFDREMERLQREYIALTREVIQTAFDAEYKVAKGHIELPKKQNIITPGVQGDARNDVLDLMKGR